MIGMADPPKKKKPSKSKGRNPVVFLTLDLATDAALQAFIAAQPVEPDRSAVALKALRRFLMDQGFPPSSP